MNTPNPLVPQGTFADKGKSQIRITVFAILAIHVVLLGLLLIAGCNKKPGDQAQDNTAPITPPPDMWPGAPTSGAPATATTTDPTAGAVPPPVLPPSTTVVTPVAPTPITPPPTDLVPPAGVTEHTIAKGESFYSIGKKYSVGYKAIVDANPGVNPNRLKIGDKIKIPAAKMATASAAGPSTVAVAQGDGSKTYKVKSGDNLMKIAKTTGVSVKALRAANNLKTDQIKVGQTLKLPPKAASPPVEAAAVPPVQPPAAGGVPQ